MVNLNKVNKAELGKLLTPQKVYTFSFKKHLEEVYQKVYQDNLNYFIITNLFFVSLICSLIAYIFLYPHLVHLFSSYMSFFPYKVGIIFVSWFLLSLLVFYFAIFAFLFYVDSRFKATEAEIERDLPDFIDSLVSNLKGGISIEKALIKSVRPEQKALLKEVALINEKVIMGYSVLSALEDFRNRFNSPILNRTIFLIEEGMNGGGYLAAPLGKISKNLKRIYALDEEIKANSSGFSIIIRAITLIVAPLLFALALTLLTFIGSLFSLLTGTDSTVFTGIGTVPAEFPIYLKIFSFSMLTVITFFSSLITSQLKNEKYYEALKYLPFYILVTLFLYSWFSDLLLGVFSGVVNF